MGHPSVAADTELQGKISIELGNIIICLGWDWDSFGFFFLDANSPGDWFLLVGVSLPRVWWW